ncbi:MAG: class I tRNA ligase family protein, partial [Gammaproteobacteria bacterium]|nr:class I tRNA ligase family protein [Gammaproteobacteria bacterium]
LEIAIQVLSPIIPHVCHALWGELGHREALIDARWPTPDAAALEQQSIEIVVQVNGRLRAHITVPAHADEASVRATALADPQVQKYVGGQPVRRVIVVPHKLVNVVI